MKILVSSAPGVKVFGPSSKSSEDVNVRLDIRQESHRCDPTITLVARVDNPSYDTIYISTLQEGLGEEYLLEGSLSHHTCNDLIIAHIDKEDNMKEVHFRFTLDQLTFIVVVTLSELNQYFKTRARNWSFEA